MAAARKLQHATPADPPAEQQFEQRTSVQESCAIDLQWTLQRDILKKPGFSPPAQSLRWQRKPRGRSGRATPRPSAPPRAVEAPAGHTSTGRSTCAARRRSAPRTASRRGSRRCRTWPPPNTRRRAEPNTSRPRVPKRLRQTGLVGVQRHGPGQQQKGEHDAEHAQRRPIRSRHASSRSSKAMNAVPHAVVPSRFARQALQQMVAGDPAHPTRGDRVSVGFLERDDREDEREPGQRVHRQRPVREPVRFCRFVLLGRLQPLDQPLCPRHRSREGADEKKCQRAANGRLGRVKAGLIRGKCHAAEHDRNSERIAGGAKRGPDDGWSSPQTVSVGSRSA